MTSFRNYKTLMYVQYPCSSTQNHSNPQPLGLTGQNLLHLVLMLGEVIDQVIPHGRLVLMSLVAVPCIVGDGEWAARLEHEGNRSLGDAHHRRWVLGRGLEFLVGDAVRDHFSNLR